MATPFLTFFKWQTEKQLPSISISIEMIL